jgi:hypothetical protein
VLGIDDTRQEGSNTAEPVLLNLINLVSVNLKEMSYPSSKYRTFKVIKSKYF